MAKKRRRSKEQLVLDALGGGIWWRLSDADVIQHPGNKDTRWYRDPDGHAWYAHPRDNWQLHQSNFTTLDGSPMYQRAVDPRTEE